MRTVTPRAQAFKDSRLTQDTAEPCIALQRVRSAPASGGIRDWTSVSGQQFRHINPSTRVIAREYPSVQDTAQECQIAHFAPRVLLVSPGISPYNRDRAVHPRRYAVRVFSVGSVIEETSHDDDHPCLGLGRGIVSGVAVWGLGRTGDGPGRVCTRLHRRGRRRL